MGEKDTWYEKIKRYPDYRYMVKLVDDKTKWIYIGEPDSEGWEEDMMSAFENEGPIEFLRRIAEDQSWTIQKDDESYVFKEDPLKI